MQSNLSSINSKETIKLNCNETEVTQPVPVEIVVYWIRYPDVAAYTGHNFFLSNLTRFSRKTEPERRWRMLRLITRNFNVGILYLMMLSALNKG
jgi:hypothetical protein